MEIQFSEFQNIYYKVSIFTAIRQKNDLFRINKYLNAIFRNRSHLLQSFSIEKYKSQNKYKNILSYICILNFSHLFKVELN